MGDDASVEDALVAAGSVAGSVAPADLDVASPEPAPVLTRTRGLVPGRLRGGVLGLLRGCVLGLVRGCLRGRLRGWRTVQP